MKACRSGVKFRDARRERCRGQSLVIVTLVMPVLAGLASLATDAGLFYFNYFRVQQAIDSAVLSGASYLPAYPAQAVQTAITYAGSNGIQSGEITSTQVDLSNTSLTMNVSRQVPFFFAQILGQNSGKINTSATAKVMSVGSASGLTPLGIDYRTPYTYGQTVMVHQGQVGPGNWGALALGASGDSNYVSNLENGYSGTVNVGDWVQTEPGKAPNATQTGINYRIAAGQSSDPSGTFGDHALNDPRVMLAAMVDFSQVNGSSQVPIKGFAELWIVGVDNQGNITTYFIEQTSPGTVPVSGVSNFGAYTPMLVQ